MPPYCDEHDRYYEYINDETNPQKRILTCPICYDNEEMTSKYPEED